MVCYFYMGVLLNETFFKFLLGFVAIVLASLVIIVIASGYIVRDDMTADAACPVGEVC